ncbi:MAG: ATP synthase F0 subunit C [Desulfovibrionaceae bacterium]|nr:ATP synthase F0 subunit C [Desulfovibrionaceae bacterium]
MRKILSALLASVAVLGLAGIALAAEPAAAAAPAKVMLDSTSLGYAVMTAVIAMCIAAVGCGFAQGQGLKAACEGIARNPDASQKVQVTLILGLAFVESLAIYTLVVSLIVLFANPFV